MKRVGSSVSLRRLRSSLFNEQLPRNCRSNDCPWTRTPAKTYPPSHVVATTTTCLALCLSLRYRSTVSRFHATAVRRSSWCRGSCASPLSLQSCLLRWFASKWAQCSVVASIVQPVDSSHDPCERLHPPSASSLFFTHNPLVSHRILVGLVRLIFSDALTRTATRPLSTRPRSSRSATPHRLSSPSTSSYSRSPPTSKL